MDAEEIKKARRKENMDLIFTWMGLIVLIIIGYFVHNRVFIWAGWIFSSFYAYVTFSKIRMRKNQNNEKIN